MPTERTGPVRAADGGAEAPPSPGALPVLLLASTLTVMAGALLSPAVPLIAADLDVTDTRAGLVVTLHALSLALASPVVGLLVDRHGPRAVLAAGLVLYGVAGGAGAVAPGYLPLLATRLVFGVGAAAVFAASAVLFLRLSSGSRQASLLGMRSTATSLGGVVWPLVGGAAAVAGWRLPFAAYLVGVPLGLAAWAVLPRDVDRARETPGSWSTTTILRRRPVAMGLCLLFGLGTALLYLALVFVPIALAASGTRSSLAIATVAASMSAAMSLSALGYPLLSGRLSRLRLLSVSYGVIGLGLFLLAGAESVPGMASAAAVFGAGFGPTIPALTAMLGAAVPGEVLGRAMALSGTAIFLGQFLSPLVFGPLVDHSSAETGFRVAGAIAALVAVVAWLGSVPRAGSANVTH